MIKYMLEFDQETIKQFEKKPDQMRAGALRGLRDGMLIVEGRVKRKLSGQVLKVRTGHLRRSISSEVQARRGYFLGVVGTHVGYGKVHELGYRGPVSVRAHTRRGFGVRAHTRNVNIPARPYLKPSIKERWRLVAKRIATTMRKAMNK